MMRVNGLMGLVCTVLSGCSRSPATSETPRVCASCASSIRESASTAGGPSATRCRGRDGSDLPALRFPEQVAKRVLRDKEAERLFTHPRELEVRAGDVVVTADRLGLAAVVTNTSALTFPLVVNPYGGTLPYGGDNPFLLRFSDASNTVVKYSGKLFPPEPPLPLLIEIPGSSCVRFEAEIDLRNYVYHGSSEVELEWDFHYFKGDYPHGRKRVRLPAR
jgi:hypothetical protein